jgi:dUTP pyrophosphatase
MKNKIKIKQKGTVTMNVKIKRLYKEASLPTKGSEKAAAYDVYACITNDTGLVTIEPHTTVKIGTGLSMAPPEGFFVGVYARSGLSSKEGLRPANCVGVCDEDYRGEYIVALHNDSKESRTVKHGDRIAQIILQKRYDMDFEEVEDLNETKRGGGGFGSTGKR